jgi:hypothetical protein
MKKNFLRICVALLGITLVACLDDDKYALDPSGTENVIEFYDPSVPTSPSGCDISGVDCHYGSSVFFCAGTDNQLLGP